MGYDISGHNPSVTEYPQYCKDLEKKYSTGEDDFFWLDKATDAERSQWHYQDTKWKSENDGVYFRSPVWLWPTTWTFVGHLMNDLIDEKLFDRGYYNDFAGYNEDIAKQISVVIKDAISTGELKHMYKQYASQMKAKGRVNEDDVGYKKVSTSAGYDYEIKTDPKVETYHSFNRLKNHLNAFADFCAASGGFTIG